MCDKCHDEINPIEEAFVVYLSTVLPEHDSQTLQNVLNMCVLELFTRTPKGQFPEIFKNLVSMFDEVLDEDNHPTQMAEVFVQRDKVQAQFAQDKFADEGTQEIESLLSDHGVLDEDEHYGTYL